MKDSIKFPIYFSENRSRKYNPYKYSNYPHPNIYIAVMIISIELLKENSNNYLERIRIKLR